MRIIGVLSIGLLLAACGVDGAPSAPEPEPAQQPTGGFTVSGTASAGVTARR